MNTKRNKLSAFFVFLCVFLLLNGCATLGPIYTRVDTIPGGKAIVYIYRPPSFMGGGVAYDVKVGDTVITTLQSGGYYPYLAEPGEKEFWAKTESRSAVTLDIKPGQIYYLKGTVGIGFFVGRPHLIVVASDIGEKESAECKLIPDVDKAKK